MPDITFLNTHTAASSLESILTHFVSNAFTLSAVPVLHRPLLDKVHLVDQAGPDHLEAPVVHKLLETVVQEEIFSQDPLEGLQELRGFSLVHGEGGEQVEGLVSDGSTEWTHLMK